MSSSSSIRRLIGQFKSHLHGALTSAESLIEQDLTSKSNQELHSLAQRIRDHVSKARQHREALKSQHKDWIALLSELEPEEKAKEEKVQSNYIAEYGSYVDILVEAKTRLAAVESHLELINKELQEEHRRPPVSKNDGALSDFEEDETQASGPEAVQPMGHRPRTVVNLPQLTLPTFNGNIFNWQQFWDAYETSIHLQNYLTPTEKFTYLRSLLTGAAAREISGISPSQANYNRAIDKLHRRFGKQEVIRSELLARLRDVRPAKDNVMELRRTMELVSDCIAQLDALRADTDHELIESTITMKFPESVLDRIYAAKSKAIGWNTTKLLEELDDIISQRELIYRLKSIANRQSNSEQSNNRTTSTREETTGEQSRSSQSNNRRGKCSFCGNNHRSSECRTYATAEARKERIRSLKLCFNCLGSNHSSNDCPSTKTCFHCSRRHHTLTCTSAGKPPTRTNNVPAFNAAAKPFVPSGANAVPLGSIRTNFQQVETRKHTTFLSFADYTTAQNLEPRNRIEIPLARLDIASNCNERRAATVAVLDTGSTDNYITYELAQQLKLRPVQTRLPIAVQTLNGGAHQAPLITDIYEATLLPTQDSPYSLRFYAIPKIMNTSWYQLPTPNARFQSTWARGDFAIMQETPSMLLGAAASLRLLDGFKVSRLHDGSRILHTRTGPVALSLAPCNQPPVCLWATSSSIVGIPKTVNEPTYTPVLGDMEAPDFDLEELNQPNDDKEAEKQFKQTVRRLADGRYSVSFPKRPEAPVLSTNIGRCIGRLRSELKHLQKDPVLLTKYQATIEEQLQMGILEVVDPPKSNAQFARNAEGGIIHYIPHSSVKPPGKFRIVYDASCQCTVTQTSVNETLLRGSVLLPSLAGILLRFRIYTVPILGDLEKAFLTVALNPPDRDLTRFVWVHNPYLPANTVNIRHLRFTRVPFGFISSPYLLAAVIQHHLQTSESQLAEQVLRDLYVDNLLIGAESVNEAVDKIDELRQLFNDAKMNLRDFATSDSKLKEILIEQGIEPPEEVKMLGIRWNTSEDSLSLQMKSAEHSPATKRQMLSEQAASFDPNGFLSPLTIRGRVLLQEVALARTGWDDQLDPEMCSRWAQMNAERQSEIFTFPRHLADIKGEITLHVFVDASQIAYAAVVYLVNEKTQCVQLTAAKAKLCPTRRKLSIPKMELLGAHLGVILSEFIVQEMTQIPSLNITKQYLWSDSMCVLHWIKATAESHREVFIRNRIRKIHCSEALTFKYVPTQDNPADIATKGANATHLKSHKLWWEGPSWLTERNDWPNVTIEPQTSEPTTLLTQINQEPLQPVIDTTRYGSWTKALLVMTTVLQFIGKLRRQPLTRTRASQMAENSLLWQAQSQEPSPDKGTSLRQHEDGLWRYHSRLPPRLNSEQHQPVWLPRDSDLARLLTLHVHHLHLHSGAAQTLSLLRNDYWIPKGRSTVKRILKAHCPTCQRYDAPPYHLPDFPHLPATRVNPQIPFANTGLDYAGPIQLKDKNGKANERTKVWITIYTCLVTRATQLDIVQDLSTKSFLLSFRRLAARVGRPNFVLSDNATTFRAAADYLNRTERFATMHWKFITQLSPWQGGIYERLIGIMKRNLRRTIGRNLLEIDEFRTLLAECENAMNTRPITTITSDELEALTPAHFMRPLFASASKIQDFPRDPKETQEEENDPEWLPVLTTADQLSKSWLRTRKLIERFWRYWSEDYLSTLMDRNQVSHRQPNSTNHSVPSIGQIVLVADKTAPRAEWKLARIRVLPDQAVIRSAEIELPSGRTTNRPLSLLHPLELQQSQNVDPIEENRLPARPKNNSSKPNHALLTLILSVLAICCLPTSAIAANVSEGNSTNQCTPNDCMPWAWSCCSTAQKIGTIVLTITVLLGLWCLNRVCRPFRPAITATFTQLRAPFRRHVSQLPTRRPPPARTERSRNYSRVRYSMLVAFTLLTLIQQADGCNLITTITAKTQDCTSQNLHDADPTIHCIPQQVIILNLPPSKSTTCIVIKSKRWQNETIGVLKLTTSGITYHCQKKVHFYTRDHEIVTESRHRCPGALGSQCEGTFCGKVRSDTHLTDLSPRANLLPGYSACSSSCQGLSCNFCLLPMPSCLFYRHFARPKSPVIYEVFSCPIWTITAEITLDINNETQRVVLHQNQPSRLQLNQTRYGTIDIAANSITTPPLPILSSTFLQNLSTNRTARTWISPPGHPVAGTIGQLQCLTLQEAKQFKCKYPHNACSCTNSLFSATCTCFEVAPEESLHHPEHLLPLQATFGQIITDGTSIKAELTQQAAISLQITLTNFVGVIARQPTLCRLNVGLLEGCYSCAQGARLAVQCSSSPEGDTSGIIQCGTQLISIDCRAEPSNKTIVLHVETPEVDLRCFLQCPDNSVEFLVHGDLEASPDLTGSQDSSHFSPVNTTFFWASATQEVGTRLSATFKPIWTAVKEVATAVRLLSGNWKTLLIIGIVIFLLYLLLPLLLKPPVPLRLISPF